MLLLSFFPLRFYFTVWTIQLKVKSQIVSFFARVSNMSGGRGRGWLLWNEQLKETFILFILLRLTAASGSFAAQQVIWWLITDTNSWHFMTITEHLWKTGNVSVHMTALPFIRIFIFKQMNVTWFNSAKLQKQDAGEKKGKVSAKCNEGQAASRLRQEEL